MKSEARYYKKLENQTVRCQLCPANCKLKPGKLGFCDSRFNKDGILFTDNFGETVTVSLDPIEKKPLYHFLPDTNIVSIGANACNMTCKHCQNWQISQTKVPTTYIAPAALPDVGRQNRSIGVAYTYTEPIIWFEYIMESAPLVKQAGLANVMVTNGYINPEPLEELLPLIDAFNVDLKSIRPEFYSKICGGKLEPVKNTIKRIASSDSHLELTYLVITGLNDSDDDFAQLGEFIASVDKKIPLHISAYHPSYKLDLPATDTITLKNAYEILSSHLSYVFVGNREIKGCSDSRCQSCGKTLIIRSGYQIAVDAVDSRGNCRECGQSSEIIISIQ
ncbi:MAG: AmmeMemoRadiSam system radical SAM enzyme [candidate division Zixibacteria bacterium]|nr:AmmeMemoRadiSam system radical SAM enzyme [candidate division Zixibacteria bacterium]